MMKRFVQGAIRVYTMLISPVLGPNCRFQPTCSAYARQAVEDHGVIKGLWLATKRIGKCNPLHKGPFHDPVPHKCDAHKPYNKSPEK